MTVHHIRIITAALACALILFGLGQSARAGTLLAMGVEETTGTIDLTAQGVLDWADWGLNLPTDFDQKAGITSLIGNYVPVGTSSNYLQYGNNAQGFSWTDGTPDSSASASTTGIYVSGVSNGFEVDISAAATNRLFSIYVGVYNATMHFEASLSDSSAPVYVDETLSGVQNRRYDLIYSTSSPGQTMRVKYWVLTDLGGGNVTLQAATVQPVPALSVSEPVLSPTNLVAAGSTVNLSIQPQGAFPYYYQWRVNSGSGFASIPNSNTNTLYVNTTGLHGTYIYDVVLTNNVGGAVTSAPTTLTVTVPTGTLLAMGVDETPTAVDLTAQGVLDWAHWGLNLPTDFDQKNGITSLIGNYLPVGASGSYLQYGNNAQGFSWTDGTPDANASNSTTGIYVSGVGNGFEVDIPAATTNRLFSIYVGVYNATMHFEASLSDNSVPVYVDETLSGIQNRRYDLIYSTPSPGQTLRVKYWVLTDLGGGNVTLQAATVQPVPALSVSQPVLSPTNLVAAGSTVNLSVQPQGAFPYYYQWQVNSGSGFAAIPNSNTNTLYVNTTGLHGNYIYEVVLTNNAGGAVTSAPTTLTVTVPAGELVAMGVDETPTAVDLTAQGVLDWAHWGLNLPTDFDQKAGITSLIGNYVPVGTSGNYLQYGNNAQGFSWTDGTPDSSVSASTTGIYVSAIGNGFEVDIPAAATNRLFSIYVGVWNATMHFEASLTDNSAPVYVDETLSGMQNRRYDLTYSTPSPGQTLRVKYWVLKDLGGGNVTLQAATLQPGAPPPVRLSIQPMGQGNLLLTWPYGTLLQSTNVTGPWATNTQASPLTVTPNGPQKFYRVQVQ